MTDHEARRSIFRTRSIEEMKREMPLLSEEALVLLSLNKRTPESAKVEEILNPGGFGGEPASLDGFWAQDPALAETKKRLRDGRATLTIVRDLPESSPHPLDRFSGRSTSHRAICSLAAAWIEEKWSVGPSKVEAYMERNFGKCGSSWPFKWVSDEMLRGFCSLPGGGRADVVASDESLYVEAGFVSSPDKVTCVLDAGRAILVIPYPSAIGFDDLYGFLYEPANLLPVKASSPSSNNALASLIQDYGYDQFVADFWRNKSPRTIKAYKEDILRIADWLGLKTIEEFAEQFLALGPGRANVVAERFKDWATREKKWGPAYVNNHLAAVRSIIKFARKSGKITWALDVEDVKVETYRDTRGPGLAGVAAVIAQAAKQENQARATRDVAILELFGSNGLRRDEVVSLDIEHLDFANSRVFVKRKKKKSRVWVTLPRQTIEALRAWLVHRGDVPGPLFLSYGIRGRRDDSRLAESSVWAIVKQHAAAAGIKTRPHALRHSAITAVLDLTGGDVRAAQRFAGHDNPATTMRYDDNLRDVAGESAAKVADALEAEIKKHKDAPGGDAPAKAP